MVSVFQLPDGVKAKNVIQKLGSLGGTALQINLQVINNDYVNETDLTRKMRIFTGEVNGSIFKNAVFPLKGEIDSNETPGYSDQDIEGPPPKRNPLNRIRGCFMGN
ncbi:MAG: hypothetical protein GW942_02615 [Candidatus Pacebacteria bacterium]|nr:hypothetical protein [Candidatus Paceibacterota bacterium]